MEEDHLNCEPACLFVASLENFNKNLNRILQFLNLISFHEIYFLLT
jgi:hypothetical protein